MKNHILTVTLNPCIDKYLNIDEFKFGGLNRVSSSRSDAGGKGINVAKVLGGFGSSVICYTLLAGDGGAFIRNQLNMAGIPSVFREVPGELRTNIKLLDSHTGLVTELNERGFVLEKEEVSGILKDIESLLSDTDIMILAGSLPGGVDDNLYGRLIDLAEGYGVRVILDADGSRLAKAVSHKPYAIKPNIHEFEELCGRKLDSVDSLISAAGEWIQKGIELIVISMGAQGSVYVDSQSACVAQPLPIECRSTVGAGDSMVAALAYSMQKASPLSDIAAMCTCAGSLTCAREGTEVCTRREVEASLSAARVKTIELPWLTKDYSG